MKPGVLAERNAFLLSERGPSRPQRQIVAKAASNANRIDQLPQLVKGWIADDAPLLVTCALGDDAPAAEPLVREIASARDGRETVLIVCENRAHPCYERLANDGRLTVCHAVVDRVCIAPKTARLPDRRRQVLVHAVWEWVVEQAPSQPEVLRQLESGGVLVVDDIAPFRERKLLVVNGLHQILALKCRLLGIEHLALGARHAEVLAVAEPFLDAIEAAHRARWPDFAHDVTYGPERVRVFGDMPDTTERILGDHLVRANLTSLLDRLDARVFAGARTASEHGFDVAVFADVVDLLIAIVGDGDLYYEPPELPAAVDDRTVVERFGALLRGWTTPRQSEQFVERFAEALAVTAA
ncbi:hypothetical protein [Conexibacter arvalis]|uniref:Uncharacterized protein n=1 Tax=Conexibacter arvalis TaxID=912552 RepID=A0A840IFG3_9ACTN|nr:hypothetical protein [Conexibacter arvalis]MBB4662804.1 hypothetical protein [Conexibacter arvalis]